MQHARTLAKSFLKTGTCNTEVKVVVRWEKLKGRFGVKTLRDLKNKTIMWFEEHEVPYETICGNHTREACLLILSKYPNHPVFKEITWDLYVCEGSHSCKTELRLVGDLHNIIRGVQRADSFIDLLTSTRDRYLDDRDNLGNSFHQQSWNTRQCELYMERSKKSKGSWDFLRKMITAGEEEFKMISTIVNPPAALKVKWKAQKSTTFYVPLMALSESDRIKILKSVVCGDLSIKASRLEAYKIKGNPLILMRCAQPEP